MNPYAHAHSSLIEGETVVALTPSCDVIVTGKAWRFPESSPFENPWGFVMNL